MVNVRTAKARLSELLERAAAGEEVVITSAGKPKAKLVPVTVESKPFRVNRRLLGSRVVTKGTPAETPAETIVRADRDERD